MRGGGRERRAREFTTALRPRHRTSTILNKFTIKGKWNELMQKYADLTDDDLTYAEGKEK